ncbi:hypothetical protein AHAS_Ahas15G0081900 [Arachis hypogaea]
MIALCADPQLAEGLESLITNVMWRNLIIQAIYQVTILLILNFGWQSINLGDDQDSKSHSLQVKNTLIFNTFVLCQIFNEFNARKIDQMNVFKGVTKSSLGNCWSDICASGKQASNCYSKLIV